MYKRQLVDSRSRSPIEGSTINSESETSDYEPSDDVGNSFQWSKSTFNDFCRELNLSQRQSLKCLSMLRKDNYLKQELKNISTQLIKHRSETFRLFFQMASHIAMIFVLL